MRRPERIQRKTGHRYQVRFRGSDGRMDYRIFRTEREALRFSREIEDRKDKGQPMDFEKTFTELAAEFRAAHIAHSLRPSSKKDALRILARLERRFGPQKLTAIHAPDLERFRDEELATLRAGRQAAVADRLRALRLALPVARREDSRARILRNIAQLEAVTPKIAAAGVREINKCVALARQLFKFAVGRRYAAYNPAEHCRALKKSEAVPDALREEAVLRPAEVMRLAEAAEDPREPPLPGRAAILVLGLGGLRLGELLGLCWGDIEFPANRLLVRRQLEATTGELRDTKTKAGTRFVSLPPEVMVALKAWKLRCPKGPLDLVFPNSAGRPMDDRDFRTRCFYPALRRAGLRRIRCHDLRHTAASFLIATGADISSISRQLGHANVAITLGTYSHWFAQRAESDLGTRLAALMARETEGCEMVAASGAARRDSTEVVDSVVARGGIEPPTRGFSVRCSTN